MQETEESSNETHPTQSHTILNRFRVVEYGSKQANAYIILGVTSRKTAT